jgi:hypothetical protein
VLANALGSTASCASHERIQRTFKEEHLSATFLSKRLFPMVAVLPPELLDLLQQQCPCRETQIVQLATYYNVSGLHTPAYEPT